MLLYYFHKMHCVSQIQLLFLTNHLLEVIRGAPRLGVVVDGTTLGPNWKSESGVGKNDITIKLLGRTLTLTCMPTVHFLIIIFPGSLAEMCPSNYPFATANYDSCCTTNVTINNPLIVPECDGRPLDEWTKPECCPRIRNCINKCKNWKRKWKEKTDC